MARQTGAATITVTNTNDSGPGSLLQALANANNGDTINFAVTGTITLIDEELLVRKSVRVSGPGANQLSIDGSNASPIFHVVSGRNVTISGLTITNGNTGIANDEAILTVSNCVVSGSLYAGLFNNDSLSASAIASLTIIDSLFSDNDLGIINPSEPPFGPTRTIARGSTLTGNPAHES